MTFAPQINSFWLFSNSIMIVGDGDKLSNENFGLGRPRFLAKKLKLKYFSRKR